MPLRNSRVARGTRSSDNHVESSRKLEKKRRDRVEMCEIDDSMKGFDVRSPVDAGYLKFLTSDSMSMLETPVCTMPDVDDSDKDPQYEMFWSSLKKYGNSCILEVREGNGLENPIIYEAEEDVFHEELNQSTRGKSTDTESEGGIEGEKGVHSLSNSPVTSNNSFSIEYVSSSYSEGQDRHDKVDIQDETRKKGQRYALRSKNNKKKVEEHVNSPLDDEYVSWPHGATSSERPNLFCEDGPDEIVNLEANKRGRYNSSSRNYASWSRGNEVEVKEESSDRDIDEHAGVSKRKSSQPGNKTYFQNRNSQHAASSEESDGSKVEPDDKSVRTGDFNREVSSEFRNELMKKLREPYSEKEHKTLSDLVKNRKPVGRHIDLRHGRTKFFSGDKDGKSYLDCHPGLRKKLRAAKDEYEKLNLLRGFFFWLKNLTWDGEFQPWFDEECLAVVPKAVGRRRRK